MPKGFVAISGGSGDSVDWKKGKVVTGVVKEIKTITIPAKKKGEKPKDTRLMRVETKEGDVTVWEKAALTGLFDKAKRGKQVYIEHLGMGKAKPGQSKPNLFLAAMK